MSRKNSAGTVPQATQISNYLQVARGYWKEYRFDEGDAAYRAALQLAKEYKTYYRRFYKIRRASHV